MLEHYFMKLSHWEAWILGLMLLVIIVSGAFILSQNRKKISRNYDRLDSLEILKSRLARGDISVEEFNTLRGFLDIK